MGCAVPVYHGIPTGMVGSVTEGRRVADGKGIAAQGPSTTHTMTPRSAQPMRSYCRCCWLSGPRAAVRLGRYVWSSPRAPWPRDASRPPSFPRASSRGRPARIRCRCRDEAPGTAKASRAVEANASTNKAAQSALVAAVHTQEACSAGRLCARCSSTCVEYPFPFEEETRTKCNMQHATYSMQHANIQHATYQHATYSMQHANMQHAAYSIQHAACQHATCNMGHATCNMQHATDNMP
jgi:hypothetical protein